MSKIQNFSGWADNLQEDLGDLLESHEETPDPSRFTRYENDPVGFITDIIGEEPWSAQRDIAKSVLGHPLTVARSCNSAGKDWIAARLALWWVYARRGLALITGPTERQVKEIVMGEVVRAFSKANELPGELFTNSLRVGRESQAGILSFTSTAASRLTGFHAPRVLGIITEGQAVESFAYEGFLSCAVGEEDRLLVVGNPVRPSGKFYEIGRAGHWAEIQISAEEHPNVEQGETVIPGGVTRAFVDRMRQEYGETSDTYRSRVKGEFPSSGENSLFDRRWLKRAACRWDEGAFEEEAEDATPVVACDPARYGTDSTVVAVRRGPVVERLVGWTKAGTMDTVARLREIMEEEGVPNAPEWEREDPDAKLGELPRIVVDDAGPGAGVTDRLEELEFNVCPFNGAASPVEDDRKRFRNLRAEAYWHLRRLLERDEVALPNDPDLFDELMAVRWERDSSGKIKVERKGNIRARLGHSPDRADAVVMAVMGRSLDAAFDRWVAYWGAEDYE